MHECIWLSVFSVAQVMIALWANAWMNLAVCLLHGPGHDSSVGEWMNLTVCPPCGPGHDSSVGEWMNLTVCPPCGPGHDSSVGEWMDLTVCPPCGPGSISSRVFQGICPWLSSLCQPVLSQSARRGLSLTPMTPRNLWTSEEESPSPIMDRQWLNKQDARMG